MDLLYMKIIKSAHSSADSKFIFFVDLKFFNAVLSSYTRLNKVTKKT